MKKMLLMITLVVPVITGISLLMSSPAVGQPPLPTLVNMYFRGDSSFPSITEYADTSGLARFTGSAFRLTPDERDYVVQKIVELAREDFKDFNIKLKTPPFTAGAYEWGIDDSFYVFYDQPSACTSGGWGRLYGKAGGNPNILPGPCADPGQYPEYARTWAGSFAIYPDLDPNVVSSPPLIPYIHCTQAERHPTTGWFCGHYRSISETVTVDHVAQALANSAAHEIAHLFGALHTGQIDPVTGNPVNARGGLLESVFEWAEGSTNKSFGTDNYNILMRTLGAAPPESPELTSPTHGIGQTSCEQVLTVEWETPYAVQGVGGYSYTIVEHDDPFYDLNRWPDETIDLDSSATSFTTPPLGSGTWEFNILTIDSEGLPARFYATFHADIDSCSVNITRPRSGDSFEVGEWTNVYWEPVTYGGLDVGGGYTVETIDLLKGPNFVSNLVSNQANVLYAGFWVPDVESGSDYNIRIVLKNALFDLFPQYPERLIGFSEYFSITRPPSADLDGDGDVDMDDINIVVACFGQPASCNPEADFNDDGIINILDLSYVGSKYTGPLP